MDSSKDRVLDSGDFYADDAEWYAACSGEWLTPQRNQLATLLPDSLDGRVVVDIGAGVGAMLSVFADRDADQIYAIEPSAGMRIGLTTHVALTPALAHTTTVLPGTLSDVLEHLPPQWDVATFLNVHGHLTAAQELAVWQNVAERLTPSGRFIVGMQPPETVEEVPETSYGSTSVGQRTWSMHGYAKPVDDQHVAWTTVRTVTDPAGQVVAGPHETTCSWRVGSLSDMKTLAKDVGLQLAREQPAAEHNMYAFGKSD